MSDDLSLPRRATTRRSKRRKLAETERSPEKDQPQTTKQSSDVAVSSWWDTKENADGQDEFWTGATTTDSKTCLESKESLSQRDALNDFLQRCASCLPRTKPDIASLHRDNTTLEGATFLKRPTLIQEYVWKSVLRWSEFISPANVEEEPPTLEVGKLSSCVLLAPTSSGKTLSYGAPLMLSAFGSDRYHAKTTTMHRNGMVLVPTRELALQVTKELERARDSYNALQKEEAAWLRGTIVACYGGVNRLTQMEALEKAVHRMDGLVVVGTPGRLVDLLSSHLDLSSNNSTTKEKAEGLRREKYQRILPKLLASIGHVVVDEADRMGLQPDLYEQVDRILSSLTHVGSIFLASATMPVRVKTKWDEWLQRVDEDKHSCVIIQVQSMRSNCLSRKVACDAVTMDTASIATADWLSQIPPHLTQVLHVCSEHKKPRKLLHTLQKVKSESRVAIGIVFFNTVKKVRLVGKLLAKERILFGELHSHMDQSSREKTLRCFHSGRIPLLLASDVAARGIHVEHVGFVINYDFPGNLEQYVHRCGRAGRKGVGLTDAKKEAVAYSFFTRNLAPMAPDLVHLLRACGQAVDPNLLELAEQPQQRHDRRESKRPKVDKQSSDIKSNDEGVNGDNDDDEFCDISSRRIALKRAANVSDPSSSESSCCSDED